LGVRNAELTKERILNAAERLFSERGIDGVSMREIASGAGVQLALISYYFSRVRGSNFGTSAAGFSTRG
jgi:AcrR family transcriptional regulator